MDAKVIPNFDPKQIRHGGKNGYMEEARTLESGSALEYSYNPAKVAGALRHRYEGIHCIRQVNAANDGYVWILYLEKGWKHRENGL